MELGSKSGSVWLQIPGIFHFTVDSLILECCWKHIFLLVNLYYTPGVLNFWELMSDLRWSWYNMKKHEVHNKYNALEFNWNSYFVHPGSWKNYLPRIQSLLPKRLGTTGKIKLEPCVVWPHLPLSQLCLTLCPVIGTSCCSQMVSACYSFCESSQAVPFLLNAFALLGLLSKYWKIQPKFHLPREACLVTSFNAP